MMFDPPDYPYKELNDTLKEQYGADTLLFANDTPINNNEPNKIPITTINQGFYSIENTISFNSNDSGRYFNIENGAALLNIPENAEQSAEFLVVPTENYMNFEPTLLDDNTVNQFLLPSKDLVDGEKSPIGPDLLAIHSCVICHDIFTTDTDLLDHTISVHASNNIQNQCQDASVNSTTEVSTNNDSSGFDFDAEWLVCTICERVLSTALEIEPSEQLCCNDGTGKGSVCTRKLHTMYVCDFCNGLFADGDALDSHKATCYCRDQPSYYSDTNVTNLGITNSPCPEPCLSYDAYDKPYSPVEEPADSRPTFQGTGVKDRRAFNPNSNNKMWNCGSCNQLFATARELYRHKRGEDRPEGAPLMAYICEECDKVLGSMCALHTHKKMHKVSKPGYPCQVCGRRFNQSGHLAIHMRMHTGERPYPCDLCPKAFKVKVERDDHRRTHTGERPFACNACPKTFTAAARLREHARIHTDQRPYRCDICGAAFRRPYARTVHTLIHTGEKPHECDICGTAFRRSGDMWKHKRTLHGIQPTTEETKGNRRH